MSSLVVAMDNKSKRGRGRPPKPGKPDYVSVKIDVKAYSKAKQLASFTGQTVAEVVSEIVSKHAKAPLAAEMKKVLEELD